MFLTVTLELRLAKKCLHGAKLSLFEEANSWLRGYFLNFV